MFWEHVGKLAARIDPRIGRRARLRAAWGQSGAQTNGWLARRFFELTQDRPGARWVDDKSWDDLEFPKLFSVLNTTLTPPGGQCLYKQLRTYVSDADELRERYETCRALRDDAALREKLQLILLGLAADSTAYVAEALLGRPPLRPWYSPLLLVWAGSCALALIASLALSWTLLIPLGLVAVNAIILFFISPRLDTEAETLLSAARLLGVADRLASVRAGALLWPLQRLAEQTAARRTLRREVRWLAMLGQDGRTLDLLIGFVILAANLCFLAKVVAYIATVERFVRSRHAWESTFELIGAVDAAIAVANFMYRHPRHCRPALSEAARIDITDGYHPLLIRPVANSVSLEGRSAVICGSNMTGKTAFIKMIGTNIVLGQTLGLCLASRATIPHSPVMASVRGEQSLESGRSRYFAEIDAVLGFIESAAQGECRVFVIDELFSGTNTIERVAAAKAVLEALGAGAQVLATTHDVELQFMLSERFVRYHFREDPAVDGFFDYTLRPGASTERNAIRLLERMGFPPAIVREALALAAKRAAGDDAAVGPK